MLNNPYRKDATIFFFLVAFFTVGAIFLFLFFALGRERRITSYEECAQSRTSKILEMYPSVCITAGGKRFIEPTDGMEDRRVPPLPPEEKAQDEFSVASTSARTYLSPGNKFSIILPSGWIVRQTETTAKIDRENTQALEIMKEGESRAYPIGRIVLDYTTPGANFALESWRNNFVPAAVPFGPYPATFGGMSFSMIESSESGGFTDGFSTDSYFGLNKEKKIALGIFSHYQSEEEQIEKKNILSSVSFDPIIWMTFKGDRFVYTNSTYKGYTFSYASTCDLTDYTLTCRTTHGSTLIQINAGGHGGGMEKMKILTDNVKKTYSFGDVTVTLIELVESKKVIGTYWITKTPLLSQEPIFGFEITSSPKEDFEETTQIMDHILTTFKFLP